MNSKERAFLRGKAANIETIFNVGKEGVTPELVASIDEALEARELIKVGVLKTCPEEKESVAEMISERTKSEIVQIMGRKITLYRWSKKNQYGI